MDWFRKIILLCALHCAVADSQTRELKSDMVHEWNQSISSNILWVQKVNNEELFYDMLPGENNNSLAILEWINPEGNSQRGYNLTIVTHNFDTLSMRVQKCSFPAEEDIEFQSPVKVTYLRSDRVVVYFSQIHRTKGRVQSPQVIDTELCKLKEATNTEPYVKLAAVYIVPLKNSFHVVFENKEICPESTWCRVSFDHDGKRISEPTSIFPEGYDAAGDDRFYPMNYDSGKEDLTVVAYRKGIYSPIRKWVPIEDLQKINFFYSNTTGYTSICWQPEDLRSVKCMWLDETHQDDKKTDSVFTIPFNRKVKKMLYTHNTVHGNIAIVKEGKNMDKKVIIGDEALYNGKCTRWMVTEFDNELKKVQLYMLGDDKSCISLVTRNCTSAKDYLSVYAYKYETKCRVYSKDFRPEQIDCGKDFV